MEFGLSEDQKLLQESIGRTLEKVSPLERVRKVAEEHAAYAGDVWQALAGLGVAGMLIAEEHGGMGMGLLDAALASEMLGRHVAPAPFVATAVMAPIALAGAGSTAQQAAWLPKLASGEAIAGVAVSERAAGAREGAGVAASGGKLTGTALFALDAAGADIFIVADMTGGLHLVKGDAKGLTRIALTSIDLTRPLGNCASTMSRRSRFAAGDAGAALKRMVDAGRVMLAADTLGAAGR